MAGRASRQVSAPAPYSVAESFLVHPYRTDALPPLLSMKGPLLGDAAGDLRAQQVVHDTGMSTRSHAMPVPELLLLCMHKPW